MVVYRWQLSTAHQDDGSSERTDKNKCDEDVKKFELSWDFMYSWEYKIV